MERPSELHPAVAGIPDHCQCHRSAGISSPLQRVDIMADHIPLLTSPTTCQTAA